MVCIHDRIKQHEDEYSLYSEYNTNGTNTINNVPTTPLQQHYKNDIKHQQVVYTPHMVHNVPNNNINNNTNNTSTPNNHNTDTNTDTNNIDNTNNDSNVDRLVVHHIQDDDRESRWSDDFEPNNTNISNNTNMNTNTNTNAMNSPIQGISGIGKHSVGGSGNGSGNGIDTSNRGRHNSMGSDGNIHNTHNTHNTVTNKYSNDISSGYHSINTHTNTQHNRFLYNYRLMKVYYYIFDKFIDLCIVMKILDVLEVIHE